MKRVGLVAKLVSSWPGDLRLGVHLHRWPLRAEDCAAFQSLSPVSPAVLQLAAALPAFVPALDAAELVGPSPWPGRQLGQSRQWEMFPAGLLVWLGSKRAGGIACQQKGRSLGWEGWEPRVSPGSSPGFVTAGWKAALLLTLIGAKMSL